MFAFVFVFVVVGLGVVMFVVMFAVMFAPCVVVVSGLALVLVNSVVPVFTRISPHTCDRSVSTRLPTESIQPRRPWISTFVSLNLLGFRLAVSTDFLISPSMYLRPSTSSCNSFSCRVF